MIKSDFYPTSNTYGTMEVTASVTNLNLTAPEVDPCRAYYMGQLKSSDVYMITPKKLKVTVDEIDPDKTTIKLEETNAPVYWGYAGTDSDMTSRRSVWDPAQNKYRGNLQFFNSLVAYYVNHWGVIRVSFTYWDFVSGGTTSYGYTNTRTRTTAGATHDFTCAEFIDFIENDTPITLTFTIDGTPTDFEIKCSDFDNSGFCSVSGQNQSFITVRQILPQGQSFYYGGGTSYTRVVPFVSTSLTDKYYAICTFKFGDTFNQTRVFFSMNSTDNIEIRDSWAGYDDTYKMQPDDEIVSIQLRNFNLTLGDLRSAIDGIESYRILVGTPNNYCIIYSTDTTGSDRQIGIENTLNLRDYYTLFCLINKYRSSGQDSTSSTAANNAVYYDYTSGDVEYYSTVALFNTDNSPKSIRASYDGDYPEFQKQLRDWQKYGYNIIDDEFDPELPPKPPRPEPGPPDDDDTEHGGDDIEPSPVTGLGGTFGFTTQYAMRGTQIEQLGSALWAGFDRNNPDIDAFIQNFVYSVDPDTGSVNMADIMEFFISLRAYPMPLGNLTSITEVGTDFYIGSGTAPLRLPNGTTPFTEKLHTANSYIEPVNAGTVSIPFWFGDYRDYKTEITLYLPYCGTAELNPADVMGCTLDCTYVVDLSTGSCTAYVWTTTWENKKYPVAILPGQLGVDIPITATNAGRVGARLLGDRINFAENIMSVLKNTATGIGAVTSGNIGTGIRATMSAFIDPAIQEQKQLAGMADRGAIAAPMLSGGRGLAAFRNPATAYVQVRSPFYAVPEKYADTVGDPAATRVQIRDCHGFNQFVNVDVSGITTDAADQAEIRRALENGIYI